jgi:RsmE family RNA methyltransferase
VNLILFEPAETVQPLARSDPRAEHLLRVLRRRPGDTFDAGLVNGPRGKGTLVAVGDAALTLAFAWGAEPPPLPPLTLIVGLPRPQTARDILRDATSLGVAAMHFVATERSEPSYARATLWTSGEWRRQLLAGAAQAFDTRLPAVTHDRSLLEAVAALPVGPVRLALDHYEASEALGTCNLLGYFPSETARPKCNPLGYTSAEQGVVLAFGPERGWGAADRAVLRGAGFALVHLGTRVLRTEAAVTAALAIVRIKLGLA